MSWEHRVHRAMDHVRTHLQDPLSLADLARVAHSSPYHFARIFKAITQETPNAFIQRARLERAVYLMKADRDRPLGDIALQVGFCALSDFSRVFKRVYGLAPSRWDRQTRLTAEIPDYDDGLAAARERCPPFRARLERHPACRLGTVRVATPFLDNDLLQQGYTELIDWFERVGVDWTKQTLLGFSWDNYETTPLERVRFDLGFTLPAGLKASGEIREQTFGAVRSVDVRVQGPRAHIALAWAHLYEDWFPRSRVEPIDLPGMKRFRRRPDQLGWDTFDLDCSIAVRPLAWASQ